MNEQQLKELTLLLSDGQWHSNQELAEKVSWRFGTVIYEARKVGYQIEKQKTSDHGFSYRLTSPEASSATEQILSLNDLIALAPYVIEQVPYIELLILFGSRARGNYSKESDWDFAVLYNQTLRKKHEEAWDWLKIWKVLEDMFDLPEGKVDCVILNDCSDVLAHFVAQDGKLLYEKEKGEFEQFQQRALKTDTELKAYRQTVREKVRTALEKWKS